MKKSTSYLSLKTLVSRGLCCLLLICFLSVSLYAQNKQPNVPPAQKITIVYTYKIVEGNSSTFGYDIYVNRHLRIHQSSIPAQAGTEGFKTKAGAEKVAQLVIEKMNKGEMPPTVSLEEMKKLKAI